MEKTVWRSKRAWFLDRRERRAKPETELIFHRWGKIDVFSGRTNLIIVYPLLELKIDLNLDYSRDEATPPSQQGGGSGLWRRSHLRRTGCNEADAVRSARPEGKKGWLKMKRTLRMDLSNWVHGKTSYTLIMHWLKRISTFFMNCSG